MSHKPANQCKTFETEPGVSAVASFDSEPGVVFSDVGAASESGVFVLPDSRPGVVRPLADPGSLPKVASWDSEPGVGSVQSSHEFLQATDNGILGLGTPASESCMFPEIFKGYGFTPAMVPELSVTSGPSTYYQAAAQATSSLSIGSFSLDINNIDSMPPAFTQSGTIDPTILNPPPVRKNKMHPGKFNTAKYNSSQISASLLTNFFLEICAVGIGIMRIRMEQRSSSMHILTIHLRMNARCVMHGFQTLPDITWPSRSRDMKLQAKRLQENNSCVPLSLSFISSLFSEHVTFRFWVWAILHHVHIFFNLHLAAWNYIHVPLLSPIVVHFQRLKFHNSIWVTLRVHLLPKFLSYSTYVSSMYHILLQNIVILQSILTWISNKALQRKKNGLCEARLEITKHINC